MIDIEYIEIAKVIELVDFEIDRVNKVRSRTATTSLGAFNPNDAEDALTEDGSRYQKEIDLLNRIKNKYSGELNKVTFKFGAKDYEHKENKPNGGN